MDMLEVGNGGMTTEEYRTHFSTWAAMKSPLILGNDLRNMSKDTFEILSNEEVIAINQDPLGIPTSLVSRQNGIDIFAGPLANGDRVVVVVNRGKKVQDVSVDFSLFIGKNADPAKFKVSAKDLWSKNILDSLSGAIPIKALASHAVRMFRVSTVEGNVFGEFTAPDPKNFKSMFNFTYMSPTENAMNQITKAQCKIPELSNGGHVSKLRLERPRKVLELNH